MRDIRTSQSVILTSLLAEVLLTSELCTFVNIAVLLWSSCLATLCFTGNGSDSLLCCSEENIVILDWSSGLRTYSVLDSDSGCCDDCRVNISVFDWSNCLGMRAGLGGASILDADWLNMAALACTCCFGAGFVISFF